MKLKSIKEKQAVTRRLLFIKNTNYITENIFKLPAMEPFTGGEDRRSPAEKENPEAMLG